MDEKSIMKLITLFLTIALICISVALAHWGAFTWDPARTHRYRYRHLANVEQAFIKPVILRAGQRHSVALNRSTKPSFCTTDTMVYSGDYWGGSGGSSRTVFGRVRLYTEFSSAIARPATNISNDYRELELFGKVFDIVRADYVDKPDDQKLITSAINGMVTGLDPHSSYMDAKSFDEMQVDTSGEFGGLGMELTVDNGLIKVVSPIDNTPASKAGILAGDIITKVDGEPIRAWR